VDNPAKPHSIARQIPVPGENVIDFKSFSYICTFSFKNVVLLNISLTSVSRSK